MRAHHDERRRPCARDTVVEPRHPLAECPRTLVPTAAAHPSIAPTRLPPRARPRRAVSKEGPVQEAGRRAA
jgi:hypothetical protein